MQGSLIGGVLNLLFGCRHRRFTRPITPFHRPGTAAEGSYVVCLECGKQFHYDVENMQMGGAVAMSGGVAQGPFQTQY